MKPLPESPPTAAPVRIAVAGALGRMGKAMCEAVLAEPGLMLAARFDRPGAVGEGLVGQDAALAAADVVIDFSTPAASTALAQVCAGRGGPALVLGATGFEPGQIAIIESAALKTPIVRAGNFSLGLNMMLGFVEQTARRLGPEAYDIEIFEAHHRRKVDAPSGAALMLGEAAARGRSVSLASVAKRGRDGITGARAPGEIGFSVVRGGGIVGEHSVSFIAEDESFTLSHSARDRSLFARGAIVAARWVFGRSPGQYDMRDVLGFSGRT